jgi:mycothiol synthase
LNLPAGYVARAACWDDVDDVLELFRACDRAEVGFEDPVREHHEESWRRAGFDLDLDAKIVVAPAGTAAAYASSFGLNPELSVEVFVRVHPDHRGLGLGSALLEWAEAHARQVIPAGASSKLTNGIPAEDEAAARLLEGRGFERVRIFWHMERELARTSSPGATPAGIRIRTYRHEVDADALYEAIEEAFVDHWGYEPYPRETHMEEIQRYEPGLVLVAMEDEEVVGAVMAKPLEDRGWVDVVAVRKPWRGRGIARAMLLRSFAAMAARGYGSVMLNVDAESRTGATRLYESVGMHVRRTWLVFEKPLPADVS